MLYPVDEVIDEVSDLPAEADVYKPEPAGRTGPSVSAPAYGESFGQAAVSGRARKPERDWIAGKPVSRGGWTGGRVPPFPGER